MSINEAATAENDLTLYRNPDWRTAFPGLQQGITGRGDARFALPGPLSQRAPAWEDGWRQLAAATGIDTIARCRQVHGASVVVCDHALPAGLNLMGEADAMVTARADLLLAVTVADCVPVFLMDPGRRVVGLAHAGWRGTAAGVVRAALEGMRGLGALEAEVYAYLGPAICGGCYEVGPEVPAALGGWPENTRRVDLRAHIRRDLEGIGLSPERVTVSAACTRCSCDRFYSYRGGDRDRRMCAFLGWSPR
jgi:YfiH family protein